MIIRMAHTKINHSFFLKGRLRMNYTKNRSLARLSMFITVFAASLLATGCSTAHEAKDQAAFRSDARAATQWFESNVSALDRQLKDSAGYIIYPSIAQWGLLIGGGQYGRGAVNHPDDSQIGWASINNASIGLQAGVRGFKMLVVFEDEATLNRFKQNKLTGSVAAVMLVAEAGGGAKASFTDGVAVYQGASTGLLAGVNIGLDYMRYEPMYK